MDFGAGAYGGGVLRAAHDGDLRLLAGFVATTTINRLDFGVSWNAPLEKDGLVVGNTVEITIDAEAMVEEP